MILFLTKVARFCLRGRMQGKQVPSSRISQIPQPPSPSTLTHINTRGISVAVGGGREQGR